MWTERNAVVVPGLPWERFDALMIPRVIALANDVLRMYYSAADGMNPMPSTSTTRTTVEYHGLNMCSTPILHPDGIILKLIPLTKIAIISPPFFYCEFRGTSLSENVPFFSPHVCLG